MVKINKILILAVSVIVLVALSGAASASASVGPVTFTVDKITRNGHYVGTPTLLDGDTHKYGYTYTFVFDGTYTLFGHATNSANTSVNAAVDLLSYRPGAGNYSYTSFSIPAAGKNSGKSDFSVSVKSPDSDFDSWGYWNGTHVVIFNVGDEDGIIVDAEDSTQHTVDEGPMSDAVAIYSDNKFVFKNTTLYSFAS